MTNLPLPARNICVLKRAGYSVSRHDGYVNIDGYAFGRWILAMSTDYVLSVAAKLRG